MIKLDHYFQVSYATNNTLVVQKSIKIRDKVPFTLHEDPINGFEAAVSVLGKLGNHLGPLRHLKNHKTIVLCFAGGSDKQDESQSFSANLAVVVAVSGVVIIAIVCASIYLFVRNRRQRREELSLLEELTSPISSPLEPESPII